MLNGARFKQDIVVSTIATQIGYVFAKWRQNDLESKIYVFKATYKVFATHVFPVRKDVLVLFSVRSARLYGESYDYYPTPCRYPDHELFLWPYFDDNLYLHWSFWDPTRSSVSFTHNKRFGFNCLEYPKIKMSSSKEIFCFLQEKEMKIIVVTIYPEKTFEIDKSVDELNTIHCISQGEHTTQILLWFVHEKSCLTKNLKSHAMTRKKPPAHSYWRSRRLTVRTSSFENTFLHLLIHLMMYT